MKYCRNCGAEVEEDDIYCGYCGSKLKEDLPKDNAYSGQDFKEETSAGADFTSNLDDDLGASFDDEFDKSFADSGDLGKRDEPQDEFESYVESGNHTQQSFNSGGNTRNPEHKNLLPNKLAKEANTFGIVALIFGFLGGVLGIVFGIIGLQKAKKAMQLCETGEYDGKPKAKDAKILSIAGIVLGVVSLIFYIL